MRTGHPTAERLLDAAFFAGFLAYVWVGIDPRLIYHWQGPAFHFRWDFAGEFFRYPGGALEWVSRLAAQAYRWQAGGAAMLGALGAAVAWVTHVYFRVLAGKALPVVRFVPAVALVYLMNLYYDRTPFALAILLGIGAAAGFAVLAAGWGRWAAAGAFVALAGAVYWLGGMALVFFAPGAALAIAGRRRGQWLAGVLVALAAGLPVMVEGLQLVFVPSPARGWFVDADWRRLAVWWGLYLFFAAGGAMALWKRAGRARQLGRLAAALAGAGVLASLGGVAWLGYDSNARDRRLALLDYSVWREDWEAVIETARGLPGGDFNSLTRAEVNLALHETHRLGDEMFGWPQTGSMLPRLRTEVFLPYMIRVTDLCLRLGRVNEAERFGHEAMILAGADARVCRLMAQLNLVKGRGEAARKFLNALSDEAGAGGWAHERLRALDADPDLKGDAGLQQLRRRMLANDDVFPVWQNPDKPEADLDRLLLDQLEQDPSNRMAFEYLMGNYLLARDLASARALMERIQGMSGPAYEGAGGRRRVPRHYQEAMAMFADGRGQLAEAAALGVEPETLDRMAVFKRIMSHSPGKEAAKGAAWDGFRATYFFYYVFGPGDYR